MRCPTPTELPPPPVGKTCWAWTEESPHLPDMMPDGSPWPRVSIVTLSYNQGQFIEETIRSEQPRVASSRAESGSSGGPTLASSYQQMDLFAAPWAEQRRLS